MRCRTVDNPEDDIRLLQFLETALNAQTLDGIGGLADARGIDETEGHPSDVHGIFYHIAGGSVDVAHDGTFLVQQRIQQGGLSGIGLADNGYRDAVLDSVSRTEGTHQSAYHLLYLGSYRLQLRTVGKLQFLVVAEVEFQFHQRGEMQQLLAQGSQFLAEASLHLIHGQPVGSRRRRGNQIGYGFGLTQVHLPVQESTLGKLSRTGGTTSVPDEKLHDLLEDVRGTVAGNLDRIFSRIGMGRMKQADQHLVDNLPSFTADGSECEGVGLASGKRQSALIGR
ncbi:putative uncharacterized protein [Bacteroides sp. CAG:714]|nr:putative uncharacterized protein [Bacteroides sp. CAG:714]